MKNSSIELLPACRLARRLGAKVEKRVICPGCGRVSVMEGDEFALRVDAGQVIPTKKNDKADGVRWCALCA
jgi:hypothetical protein